MKLFENGVGRPSNETKRKRGVVYALLSLLVVMMLMMTSFMLNSALNMEKVSGSTKLGEFFSNLIKQNPEQYGKRNKISVKLEDNSGNATKNENGVYIVSKPGDYTPTVTITQKRNKKIYYRWFTYKGLNAKSNYWSDICRVATGKEYVKNDIEYLTVNNEGILSMRSGKIKLYLTKKSCENDKDGKNSNKVITSDVINYKYFNESATTKKKNIVEINLKDKSGLESNNNIVTVSKTGDYYVEAVVKQSENANLYYRWDTFNGVSANKHVYVDTSSHGNYSFCSSFRDKKIIFSSLESLEFTDKNNPRSGKFSIYKSKNDCINNKNSVKSAVIGYKFKNSDQENSQDYKILKNYKKGNATLSNITNKIGQQTINASYDYALAYGVFIIKDGNGEFNNLKCDNHYYPAGDYGGSAYGANGSGQYDNSVKGYNQMYKKIKSTIDSNLPIIIRVNNARAGGSGTHFVTIIGYKSNASIKNWNDFKSSVWVLDPAYLEEGQVMSKPLSSYDYDLYTVEHSQLFWWNKASDAKMPKWCK